MLSWISVRINKNRYGAKPGMKPRGLAFFYVVYDEPSTDLCLHKNLYLVYLACAQNGLTDEKRTVKLLGGKQTEGT